MATIMGLQRFINKAPRNLFARSLMPFVAFSLGSFVWHGHCGLVEIDDFYSHSFVPSALAITYRIRNRTSIDYNITATEGFPGTILFNLFMRQLDSAGDADPDDLPKFHNMDFCKTIEAMQNQSEEYFHSDSLLQETFITACPLSRGIYYITNGMVDAASLPGNLAGGQYWVQFELVQIFEEMTKIMNARMRVRF